MAADKISLYERLSQPRRRNDRNTTSQNTNGSKEGSNEARKMSGSQNGKGSIKKKAPRKALGIGVDPGASHMMIGENMPTTLLKNHQ